MIRITNVGQIPSNNASKKFPWSWLKEWKNGISVRANILTGDMIIDTMVNLVSAAILNAESYIFLIEVD